MKYANGTAWFSFSGSYFRYTTDAIDTYFADFSYSGVISNTDSQAENIFKFSPINDQRVKFNVDFSSTVPTVTIAHDVNGNFEDYPEQAYPLSQAPL